VNNAERSEATNERGGAIQGRMAAFDFIEGWYTPHRRRHSALDDLSPINYERV